MISAKTNKKTLNTKNKKKHINIWFVLFSLFILIQPIINSSSTFAENKEMSVEQSVKSKLYFYAIQSCLTSLGHEREPGHYYQYRDISSQEIKNYNWFPQSMGQITAIPGGTNNKVAISFLKRSLGGDNEESSQIFCDGPNGQNGLVKAAFSLWESINTNLDSDYVFKNLICSNNGEDDGMFESYIANGKNDGSVNCSEGLSFALKPEQEGINESITTKFKTFIINKIYGGVTNNLTGAAPAFNPVETYWLNSQIFGELCTVGEKLTSQPSNTSKSFYVDEIVNNKKTRQWYNIPDNVWWTTPVKSIYLWSSPTNIKPLYGYALPENGDVFTTCKDVVSTINSNADAYLASPQTKGKETVTPDEGTVEDVTTCGNSVTGVGWIVCPVINALVGLNDMAWSITENLLIINPLKTSGNDNYVYQAWGTIRNIANVAFVIIFLMIIFSQTTGFGINNYGIKKLLPKMIIGAILVNLSFLLMQIFVDVANILGTSLYDIIKNSAPNIKTEMSFGIFMKNFIGTVGAGALTIGGVALAGGSGSAFFLLLPVLASAALAIVAALLTLAFRQAALPILAILAPLAFVASLLPNTESWFKKWKKILIDALLLYPLAAIIFSGARFAAVILWGDGTDWFKSMVAMIVLALPLGSLPFIASKGGALTDAAFKGTKGMLDKLKNPINNWSKPRAELAKARYLSENGKTKFGRSAVGGFARRAAQRNALKNKELKLRTDTANKNFDTMFEKSKFGIPARDDANLADVIANDAKNNSNTRFQNSLAGSDAILKEKISGSQLKTAQTQNDIAFQSSTNGTNAIINERAADAQLKAAQAMNTRLVSEATANTTRGVDSLMKNGFDRSDATRISTNLQYAQRRVDIENAATNSANSVYKQELNDAIVSDPNLAREFGGIDPNGAARAVASARSNVEQARNTNITAEISNLRAQQYSGNNENGTKEAQIVELLKTGKLKDGSAATYEQRNAAMRLAVQTCDYNNQADVADFMAELDSDPTLSDEQKLVLQQDFNSQMAQYSKIKSLSGGDKGSLQEGNYKGTIKEKTKKFMFGEKIAPEDWASIDKNEISLMDSIANECQLIDIDQDNQEAFVKLSRLYESIDKALSDDKISNKIKPEQKTSMESILQKILKFTNP